MAIRFHRLLELTTDKIVWSIRVRAQAVWKGINRKTNEFRGFNIIFIDDQGCRIHAFISDKISNAFADILKEGHVYTVSNFKVLNYVGEEKNRCVRNEKHIYFENHTEMKLLEHSSALLKDYAFDIFCLKDVPNFCTEDNRFLIDVAGMVQTSSARSVCAKDDVSKLHVKFVMSDGSNEVNVTLFNEFGKSFETALHGFVEEQVVVVLASAKVNKYEATKEIYLTNYPATRFDINPKHYSVLNLQRRIEDIRKEDDIDETVYTLKEIKQFSAEYLQRKVLCIVTIKKVDEQCNWFENFHVKCDKEVLLEDGRYRCTECKRNLPCPDKRFKLSTVCADSTGFVVIIIPDDELQRLTGKDVYEIENENRLADDEKRFPLIFKEMENKQYIVSLIPTEDNIKDKSNVYVANSINIPPEMSLSHNPAEPRSPEVQEISASTDIDCQKTLEFTSPPTGRSTNRTRGRKNKSLVNCETEDSVRSSKVKKS